MNQKFSASKHALTQHCLMIICINGKCAAQSLQHRQQELRILMHICAARIPHHDFFGIGDTSSILDGFLEYVMKTNSSNQRLAEMLDNNDTGIMRLSKVGDDLLVNIWVIFNCLNHQCDPTSRLDSDLDISIHCEELVRDGWRKRVRVVHNHGDGV